MQPTNPMRLVMSGLVVWSLGSGGLRADDGTKVDLKPLVELKPTAPPTPAPASPPLGVPRPPTEFVPSVAVPSPDVPRPTLQALPPAPKLSNDPLPALDLRPKADLPPLDVPKPPALTNPLDAVKPLSDAKPLDLPKTETKLEILPVPPTIVPANPDVPATAAPGLTARARVMLDVEATGQTRITVDGREFGALDPLLAGQSAATANEVTFSYAEGRAVNVSSKTREVIVESAGLPGWATRITANNAASFRFNPAKTCVDVSTKANTETVIMRFPDSGMAEMGADSAARFDLFRDQSYYVSGFGTVKAQSADGQPVMLSHQAPLTASTVQSTTMERSISEAPRPPLASGPLPTATDASGRAVLNRLTPTTDVLISGTFANGLTIRVGDRTVELGAGKAAETVSLPNGSTIEFTMDRANEVLAWRVEKGYFTLRMDGEAFRLWRANALTDESGTLRWDKSVFPHTLVLKNTTPATPNGANNMILVDLAKDVPPYSRYFDSPQPGFYASVKPGATFSYSPSETRPDAGGNKNMRVGASAPDGGVNIYRVFPNIASVVPGSTDAMYNKELLVGTDCFCMEAAPGVGASAKGTPADSSTKKIARGDLPGFGSLTPTTPTFSLPPATLSGGP